MNSTSESGPRQIIETSGGTHSSRRKQSAGESVHLRRFNIGPRLSLCFLVIVVLMLAGYGLLLWQFHLVRIRDARSSAVGQELIAVSQFQTDFFRLTARLDELAKYDDLEGLKKEAQPLSDVLQRDVDHIRKVISRLPPDLHSDRTILPTIEAIRSTLPSQLERVTALAEAADWEAVRLRLANEKKPLETEVSALVRAVEQQVSTELAAQLMETTRSQQRIRIIVPSTALLALAVAAFLGLVVMRSITRPLGRLIAGSKALAQGDFSHRVPMEGNDELAMLGEVFNDMIVRLQGLYRDVRRSEAFLAEGQNLARIGNFSWLVATDEIKWSEQLYRIFEFEPGVPVSLDLIGSRVHPEDLHLLNNMVEKARHAADKYEYEHRLLMPDGSIKHLHLIAHANRDREGRLEYIGAVQDMTQRRVSEQALERARSELAKVARVTSLGVLTASIAHEINQPLSGIITNASTCLRMLSADPPNIDGARETARRTIRDGNRTADVIARLRTLYSKKDTQPELMDLNEATRETISLSVTDLQRNRVILRHELADDLPPVNADRVQLQQVILNLLRNAWDAMSTVEDRPREMLIRTERSDGDRVRVSVKDSGVGFTTQGADKLFEAFYTTKNDGMGIGLSISRSIIEAHHGHLWATPNDGPGATFSFAIPCEPQRLADTQTHSPTNPATGSA
jgi:signal transduction histidine kinase